jgi:hypothetical protein
MTGTSAPFNVHFPQQAPVSGPRVVMEALLFGQLVEIDACLRVVADIESSSYLIIWPPNVRLHTTGGILHVVDDAGKHLVQVGDHVRLSAGEIRDAASVESRQSLSQGLPSTCSGPYWVVGEEMALVDKP